MPGLWVSPNYKHQETSLDELLIATVIWGFTLGCALFTAAKAFDQSRSMWKRSGKITGYPMLIWAEWFVSLVISILAWLHIKEIIEPSFWVYFFICKSYSALPSVLAPNPNQWCPSNSDLLDHTSTQACRRALRRIRLSLRLRRCVYAERLTRAQIQCICLIIINRIALLVVTKAHIVKIRWVVVCVLGCVNISVYCIWIPARLQTTPTYVTINFYWDRMEKVIFCLVDAGLNLYFIYLVRSKLIANGLSKYMPLYRFNLFMVGVSVSLDVILIGSMSISNDFVYVLAPLLSAPLVGPDGWLMCHSYLQFHPLVYMLKLYIEMNIADLIAKVVRATGGNGGVGKSNSNSGGTELQTTRKRATLFQSQRDHYRLDSEDERPNDPQRQYEHHFAVHSTSQEHGNECLPGEITKKTETTVSVVNRGEEEDNGSEASTSQLKKERADRMSQRSGSIV